MISIQIDAEKCTGCKICERQCPTKVFSIQNGKSGVANIKNCMACRLCETACPEFGIVVNE